MAILQQEDQELATIQYLKWIDLYRTEKPFQIFMDIPPEVQDQRSTNLSFEPKQVPVQNIRGFEGKFELDKHGFIVRSLGNGAACLSDRKLDVKLIESKYFPAIEELLRKEVEGVDQVHLLDWRARSAETSQYENTKVIDLLDLSQPLKPANYAHIDQSPLASVNHVLRELPNDAEFLLKGRVRIINIWQPLKHPVEDWPLALCDGSTVSLEQDLVETDTVRRHYQGANMYMLHRDAHKWYYLRQQQPDEALIFKQFDTAACEASCCPHSSFNQSDIPVDALPRESIELRVIVFTYPSEAR